MVRKWREQGFLWGFFVIMSVLMLSGCSLFTKDTTKMTSDEELKVKKSAVQYIQERYGKDFDVTKITKGQILDDYYIDGVIKDGKDTPIFIGLRPPNDFSDSYVNQLFTAELKPRIAELAKKNFDLREIDSGFVYGYRNGVERKYTHDIPSVFNVLKKGDQDLSLNFGLNVYDQGGQASKAIPNFLQALKKMNFNKVNVKVYIYDDQLKLASKKEDAGKHLILRYLIRTDDIQTIDINNLEQFKTVIKE